MLALLLKQVRWLVSASVQFGPGALQVTLPQPGETHVPPTQMSYDRSGVVTASQGMKSGCSPQLGTTQIPQLSLQMRPHAEQAESAVHEIAVQPSSM
jgi:hypothetical protein